VDAAAVNAQYRSRRHHGGGGIVGLLYAIVDKTHQQQDRAPLSVIRRKLHEPPVVNLNDCVQQKAGTDVMMIMGCWHGFSY
jgi:hypothetical protein